LGRAPSRGFVAGQGGRTIPQSLAARLDALQRHLGEALFARVAGPEGPANRARFNTQGPRWFSPDRPIRRVHGDASMFVGGAVALIPGNLIQLLVEAQVLNGLITPILLTYVLILANRTSVLGDAANGRAFKIVATICVVAVAVLSLTVLAQAVLSAFGIS
jgi:hypothetical protein